MANAKWQAEDIEILNDVIGIYPIELAVIEFRRMAKTRGLSDRTRRAIEQKAVELGLSFKSYGEWLAPGEVADLTGINVNRIRIWMTRYRKILGAKQFGRGKFHVSRSGWRRWAREERYQRLLGGVPAHKLFLLLEDRNLADTIARKHPRAYSCYVPVRCMETGMRWPSQQAAADANQVDKRDIWRSCNYGETVRGRRYEVVA